MAVESFANSFATTLGAAIATTGATSITTAAAAPVALQTGKFRILIDSELLIVTAGASTTTWTVTRGAEGTTAATHSNGATITHVTTAASLIAAFQERALAATVDGSFDLTLAGFLTLPNSAGAAPANTGQIAHDTTQRATNVRDSIFGNGALVRTLGAKYANADTLTAATISTTETAFATTLALPANYLLANKVLLVFVGFQFTTSASPPTLNLRLRTGTVAAGVILWASAANAQNSGKTNNTFGEFFAIQGTAAVGAAVAVQTDFAQGYIGGSPIGPSATAQPVTVATNAGITLTFTAQFGAATASNTVSLRQLVVLEAN